MRVLHIITGLGIGGAEMMLYRLTTQRREAAGGEAAAEPGVETHVIALVQGGAVEAMLREAGVPVETLGLGRGAISPGALLRLRGMIKRIQPDVIQGWMYHGNLAASLAARGLGVPVVWGLHHTALDPASTGLKTRLVNRACAWLSRRAATAGPARIVCCAQAALESHAAAGYARGRMMVIPNGFDTDVFKPDAAARGALRAELGLAADTVLIGMAGRFHPVKDHANFLKAAALLHAQRPEVHFVLCGRGVTAGNLELMAWIERDGLSGHVHLLGERGEMQRFHAALDVATNSAASEAFPLAVGEAMACGVPVVATDVGDTALIIGETGGVVPARDASALAAGWAIVLNEKRITEEKLVYLRRKRIEMYYSITRVRELYRDIHRDCLLEY